MIDERVDRNSSHLIGLAMRFQNAWITTRHLVVSQRIGSAPDVQRVTSAKVK
jgi:hypothetical protein